MNVSPIRTILFLLSVFTILLVVATTFPANGIHIGKHLHVKFASLEQIFGERPTYADVSGIIAQNQQMVDSSLVEVNDTIIEIAEPAFDTIRANADELKSTIEKIQFPANNRNLLFPAFRAMENARRRKKVVRIMHFGDSQLEGDRITSFLRYKLQGHFGGCGVGLVPAQQVYDFKYSILQENSDNWYRYTIYGNRDTALTHNRYGLLASFAQFTSPFENPATDTTQKHAWISFESSPYSYKNTKHFRQLRFIYGQCPPGVDISLQYNHQGALSESLQPTQHYKVKRWLFDTSIVAARLELSGVKSPEVYGLALDDIAGVAVDNIAMRGCSGLVFTKMDSVLLSALLKEMNVSLLILQFGGNVVPSQSKSYGYYEKWFSSQLQRLRKMAPNIPIIVIGVSDMSIKENNYYVTYPSVPKVRDALKKACFKNNTAYWDLYEAMGGENSMPSWVFATPPLATTDFVHFNSRGARLVANMFYNALWNEYAYYRTTNTPTP